MADKDDAIAIAKKYGVDENVIWPDLEARRIMALAILTKAADEDFPTKAESDLVITQRIWALSVFAPKDAGALFEKKFDEIQARKIGETK